MIGKIKYFNEMFLGKEELTKTQELPFNAFIALLQKFGTRGLFDLGREGCTLGLAIQSGGVRITLSVPQPLIAGITGETPLFINQDLSKFFQSLPTGINYIVLRPLRSNSEEGQISSINASGRVLGTGTNFTELFRDSSGKRMSRFMVGANVYTVQAVINDTELQLAGSNFPIISNPSDYKVIGTFSAFMNEGSSEVTTPIYDYFSCELDVVQDPSQIDEITTFKICQFDWQGREIDLIWGQDTVLKKLQDATSEGAGYDYVVDSDDSLQKLRNNPNAHKVLVRSGTYRYNAGNTTDPWFPLHQNTKVIDCDPNAEIIVTGSVEGWANTDPYTYTGTPVFMYPVENGMKKVSNLRIRVVVEGTPAASPNQPCFIILFQGFSNMEGCGVLDANERTALDIRGFSNCNNLKNCFIEKVKKAGYWYCNNMQYCTGNYEIETEGGATGSAFSNCTNLLGCKITGASKRNLNIFSNCRQLSQCSVFLESSVEGSDCWSYSACDSLVDCSSQLTRDNSINGNVRGFVNCNNVLGCTAHVNVGTVRSWGFERCNRVGYCLSSWNETPYESSWASYASVQGKFECADTAEGGFNGSR